jgi:hypothetical protein
VCDVKGLALFLIEKHFHTDSLDNVVGNHESCSRFPDAAQPFLQRIGIPWAEHHFW